MSDFLRTTDSGVDKYGYNADVDAAEDIWSGGGNFPWANVVANGTLTIVSGDAEDGAGTSTGALTVNVEWLKMVTRGGVTGGQIFRETVTMNGTGAITLSNTGAFVYRAQVLTTGSNNAAVGLISIKNGANTIARIEVGTNQTEMAVMIVPQFTSDGGYIHGAYLHNWGASIVANSVANMGVSIDAAPSSTTAFAIKRRGVCTVSNDINQSFHAPIFFKPGTKIRVRATSVSAANQLASAYFTLTYLIA